MKRYAALFLSCLMVISNFAAEANAQAAPAGTKKVRKSPPTKLHRIRPLHSLK